MALGILALALAARLAIVLSWDTYEPLTDGLHFDRLAASLASGEGWGETLVPAAQGPTALRAPLYPALLAVVYAVFGAHSWGAGLVANAVISTVIVGLIGLIAARLWSRRVALVAMGLAAVHPTLVLVGSPLALEPLLAALSLGVIAVALRHSRDPVGLGWPAVAGVLMGLAILTREIGFLLVPPVAWIMYRSEPSRSGSNGGRTSIHRLAAPAVLIVVAAVVVMPWTIRNAVQLDAFVPVSTSSGIGLAGTYNNTSMSSQEHPGQWIAPWDDPEMAAIMLARPDATEVSIDRDLRAASLRLIRDNPSYPVRVALWNTVRMFDLDGGTYSRFISQFVPYPERLTRLAVLASYAVALLAIAGAFQAAARRVPLAVWAIPVIMIVFMVTVLPGSIRYRGSVEPFFVMLASLTLISAYDRVSERLTRRRLDARTPLPLH